MAFYEVTVTTQHTYCVEADDESEAIDVGMEEHLFDPNTEVEVVLLKDNEVEASKRHSDKVYLGGIKSEHL